MNFDFSYFPILTTERLRLRPINANDADSLRTLFDSEPVMRFLSSPPINTHEKAVDLIERFNRYFHAGDGLNWGITLPSQNQVIGICGASELDCVNRHVDLGYLLLPSLWGNGYATEAARAVIDWSFDQLDVHRIQADCTDGNLASEHVLLKCGFKLEGIWRENCWEHERFVSLKQFGLLRSEYHAAVRK